MARIAKKEKSERLYEAILTLKTKEEYDTAVQEGWIPIFEGFRP